MKHISLAVMALIGLATHAAAQYDTRIFQVDSGGRVPFRAGETASRTTPTAEWTRFNFTVYGFHPNLKIVDVNINIDMVHSWVEDLTIWLESPSGTFVRLFDRLPGGPPQFDNFDNTYFTDEAARGIDEVDPRFTYAPYNGDYRPEQPLSAFRGERPNGVWRLHIFDNYYGDYGYLYSNGDPTFEDGVEGAPCWRGPLEDVERQTEWGENAFLGGTWLEITVPEPSSLLALTPALLWLARRRRR